MTLILHIQTVFLDNTNIKRVCGSHKVIIEKGYKCIETMQGLLLGYRVWQVIVCEK